MLLSPVCVSWPSYLCVPFDCDSNGDRSCEALESSDCRVVGREAADSPSNGDDHLSAIVYDVFLSYKVVVVVLTSPEGMMCASQK